MKPLRSILLLFAGLVAGVLGGSWFAHRADQAEASALRDRIASLETRLATPPEPPKPLAPPAEEVKKEEPAAESATAENRPRRRGPGMNAEMRTKMLERSAEKRAQKIDERLATLRRRLNLTDAQAAAVRAALEESIPDTGKAMASIMSGGAGGNRGEGFAAAGQLLTALRRDSALDPEFEKKLAPALNADQLAEYKTFSQEQRANHVEMEANKQLARLQSQMTLSPDQKDKAYAVFSDLAAKDLEKPQTGLENFLPGAAEQAQKERNEAMKGILEPEQQKVFEGMGTNIMDVAAPFVEMFNGPGLWQPPGGTPPAADAAPK